MTTQFAQSPERNPAVLALWRCYLEHKDVADDAQRKIDGWDSRRRTLADIADANNAIAREVLDMLSQCGESTSRIPARSEVG